MRKFGVSVRLPRSQNVDPHVRLTDAGILPMIGRGATLGEAPMPIRSSIRSTAGRGRLADLIATRRGPTAHAAPLHGVDHTVAQILRIRLRHPCWPPPSQQVESDQSRYVNLEGY